MGFPLAPWHMWGTSVAVDTTDVPILSGAERAAATQQLARISYKRPDSFRFLFLAELLVVPSVPTDGSTIQVDYDLIVGVGRSQATLGFTGSPGAVESTDASTTEFFRGFCRFRWQAAGGSYGPPKKWTTKVTSPVLDDTNTLLVLNDARVSDVIIAEDLQCRARLAAAGTTSDPVRVMVSAYFAPNVHLRPEWFTDREGNEPRFRGKEDGGS